jgi:hypothetical protein
LENNISVMELKFTCKWFVITGTLVILGIKYIIRPLNLFDEPVKFLLGIAPNLLGSFLIPFGVYWFFNGKKFFIARIFRIRSVYDLRLICMLGFGMLIVNEYLQLIPYFRRTFDYYDILFSLTGLLASYIVFENIMYRKMRDYRA